MKRHGNLYPLIYDFKNLHSAYLKARRNKRYRDEVMEFSALLEDNLINIQNHLMWRSYKSGAYHTFTVKEPKERLIMALPFTDRVVQHALNNIIEPIFERSFYYHSYACRRGKGSHAASKNLTEWLYNLDNQHGDAVYCIKADISKYFASIDHKILKEVIRRKIKDNDTLWLVEQIIDHNGRDISGVSIPVGNLTSQLFANIYLNELDIFIKEKLGIRHYMRYMDDFIILHTDKTYLKDILAQIEGFLAERLKLQLNPKTNIFKVKNGVDFVGYRHWHTHKKMRKANLKRIRLKIKVFVRLYADRRIDFERVNKSVQSWMGHIKHADTFRIRGKILESIVLRRKEEQ